MIEGIAGSASQGNRANLTRQFHLVEHRPAGRAADAGQPPHLTLVFDRAGWSPQLFRGVGASGVPVLRWPKGAQEKRWPETEFRERRFALPGPLGMITRRAGPPSGKWILARR